MELLKRLFKDEEKVIGLCAFKKKEQKKISFTPHFSATRLVYGTKYDKNFFVN